MSHETELKQISERIAIGERHLQTLKRKRAEIILMLRAEGHSLADIAKLTGVSRQAILQITQRIKDGQV